MRPWLGRPTWPTPLDSSDIKLLGSTLAWHKSHEGVAGPTAPTVPDPVPIGVGGGLCRQRDIESGWLRHWCGALQMVPAYHRKVWEDCFVVQALWELGALTPGHRGLGFAVGVETLPALFAARGVDVLATDLPADHRSARGWQRTGQHSSQLQQLFRPELVDADAFARHVQFRPLDMNAVPAELHGQLDFCRSVCSVEHLGSVALGLRFIEESIHCLRPGGIAVHTMEFNLRPARSGRLRSGSTVLFEEADIRALGNRLHQAGHEMLPIDFDPGDGVLDDYVDVPPFDDVPGWPAHLPRRTAISRPDGRRRRDDPTHGPPAAVWAGRARSEVWGRLGEPRPLLRQSRRLPARASTHDPSRRPRRCAARAIGEAVLGIKLYTGVITLNPQHAIAADSLATIDCGTDRHADTGLDFQTRRRAAGAPRDRACGGGGGANARPAGVRRVALRRDLSVELLGMSMR